MARSRNIKPSFFKNYDLADAGMACQLLFAGLWCMADKEGRLEDKPRLIKAELFPYYDIDVNRELTVLARLTFIYRYRVDGVDIIEVANFKKHQNPHHTEKASVLKGREFSDKSDDVSDCFREGHDINGEVTVNSPSSNGEYLADSLIPDSLNTDSLIHDEQAQIDAVAPLAPKEPRFDFKKYFLENGCDKQVLDDWMKVRKAKKGVNTKTAQDEIIEQARIANMNIQDVVKVCAKNSWCGFKASWDRQDSKPQEAYKGNVNAAFGNPQMQPPSQEEIDEMAALQAEFKRRHG